MVENIFSDEIENLSDIMYKHMTNFNKKHKAYRSIYIVSDSNPISGYLLPALAENLIQKNTVKLRRLYFVEAFDDSGISREEYAKKYPLVDFISFEDFRALGTVNKSAFFVFCDSSKPNDKWNEVIDCFADKARTSRRSNKMVISTILPRLRPIPGNISRLAEREYSYFIEKVVTDRTPEEDFYINLEKKCRTIVRNGFSRLNLLRFDNLIGCNSLITPNYNFKKIIDDAFSSGKLFITTDDYKENFTLMHAANAALSVFYALFRAKIGHVYNVSDYETSLAAFKQSLFMSFSSYLKLESNVDSFNIYTDLVNKSLGLMKISRIKCIPRKLFYNFNTAVYRAACNETDIAFDVQTKLSCYQGKLQRLKDIEIDILKEIDRICRENNIQYFLAGGSLLGAIRENKSIPWDDDLDIGMLREDFERFRRICPEALNEKYVYSSPQTDPSVHYYLDKIRLNNSYFSTAYSSRFSLRDGVFVDIIVYDQTSSFRPLEKLQVKFIKLMVGLIYIRWHDYARQNFHYMASKIALPFLRLFPWKFYHKMFDRAAMMFSKKKDAKYLLDSIGQHVHYGRFPKYYLDTVKYTEFDGITVPIPVHYDEYLSFFYGENYLPVPSLTSQCGAHRIARLDLGEYLFEDKKPGDFRDVNIDGELFEDELDETGFYEDEYYDDEDKAVSPDNAITSYSVRHSHSANKRIHPHHGGSDESKKSQHGFSKFNHGQRYNDDADDYDESDNNDRGE